MNDQRLIEAVKAGDYREAARLIKDGGDVDQQHQQGWTPLNYSAARGDLEICKLLVESGAGIYKAGEDQRTPYMIALAAGNAPVIEFFRCAQANYPGAKRKPPQRQYCNAYVLRALRE